MDNKPLFMDEKEFEGLNNSLEEEKVVEESTTEEEKVVEEPKVEEKPVLESKEEEIKVEEKPLEVEKEEPIVKQEEKHEIVESKLEKPVEEKQATKKEGFVMDVKLFTTILCSIIVAYLFLSVARNLFLGFKYYKCAHVTYDCEVQKAQK